MNIYLTSSVKLNSSGEISQRHQHAESSHSVSTCSGVTVVGWHLPERYTQTICALILHY